MPYQTAASADALGDAKGYSVHIEEVGNISFKGIIRADDTDADITLLLGNGIELLLALIKGMDIWF